MAEVLPLSEAELRLLDSLARHKIHFLLVRLSAAALQGAPVVTEDIELWFENLNDPKLTHALAQVGAAYVPPFGHNPPMLALILARVADAPKVIVGADEDVAPGNSQGADGRLRERVSRQHFEPRTCLEDEGVAALVDDVEPTHC